MVTFEILTVELRFSDVLPETILKRLGNLRTYSDDALVHAGNLVVRLSNYARRDAIEDAVLEICSEYDDVHRVLSMRVNDTVSVCTTTLYWYRNGELEIEDRIKTGQGYGPPLNWYVGPVYEFAGQRVRRGTEGGDVYPYDEQPVEYFKVRYGMYTLSYWDAVFPPDRIARCPHPRLAAGVYADLTYQIVLRQRASGPTFDSGLRERFTEFIEEFSLAPETDIEVVQMPSDHVHLLVRGTPILSPKQTTDRITYELKYGRGEQSDDGIQWRRAWLLSTGSEVERTDIEPFLRGEEVESVEEVSYWFGIERRDEAILPEDELERAFEGSLASRAELRGGGRPNVNEIVTSPGLVLVSVTCPVPYSPWVVGHWFKRAAARALGEEADALLNRRWRNDCHVSTDGERGADKIRKCVRERDI